MIGVLGGMGPAATVDFLDKLVRATPVRRDQEHLPVIVYSVPQIPDRSTAILEAGPDPLPQMLAGIDFLNAGGARLIAIACNTAHHWYEAISVRSNAPVLNIAEVTVASISPSSNERVAVFATQGTMEAGIYARSLHRRGIRTVEIPPDLQYLVNGCIASVKAGDLDAGAHQLKSAAAAAAARGATSMILGCTELPVAAAAAGDLALRGIDSSLQLAAAAARYGLERGWNRSAA